jgi:hypothetical protein
MAPNNNPNSVMAALDAAIGPMKKPLSLSERIVARFEGLVAQMKKPDDYEERRAVRRGYPQTGTGIRQGARLERQGLVRLSRKARAALRAAA